nr:hypothetical protein [Tanacetum cinerariifolium]
MKDQGNRDQLPLLYLRGVLNQRPPVRTTPPLAAGKLILEKSIAQRSVEKPNAKIAKAREKKEKLACAKVQTKRVGEGSSVIPQKKRAHKANEADGSKSEETIFVTLIHQANPKPLNKTITSHLKGIAGAAATGSRPNSVKMEVVNLSENTRIPTHPHITTIQRTEQVEHGDTHENVVFSDGEFLSFSFLYNDEDAAAYRFVPDWRLRDDLHICSF